MFVYLNSVFGLIWRSKYDIANVTNSQQAWLFFDSDDFCQTFRGKTIFD